MWLVKGEALDPHPQESWGYSTGQVSGNNKELTQRLNTGPLVAFVQSVVVFISSVDRKSARESTAESCLSRVLWQIRHLLIIQSSFAEDVQKSDSKTQQILCSNTQLLNSWRPGAG